MKHSLRCHIQNRLKMAITHNKKSGGRAVVGTGVSVVDVTQTDPADGGPLVSESFGLYGPDNLPNPADVNQGQLADCYFLACLSSLASCPAGQKYLKSIQYINASNPQQVVTQFTRNGTVTRIYSDLLISTAFEQFNPANKDLWVELFVKAYALFRYGMDAYQSLNYGDPGVVFSDLGLTALPAPPPFSDPSVFAQFKAALDGGTTCCTVCTPTPVALGGLVEDHCYAVVGGDGSSFITLRNPWGIDGGLPILTNLALANFNFSNFDEVTFAAIPVPAEVTYTQAQLDAAVAAAQEALKAQMRPIVSAIQGDLGGS